MPNSRSAVGAMSMSAGSGVSMDPVAEEHAGHEARDRCSDLRSRPWCCRRRRDPPRSRSRRPTTRGTPCCSQSAGRARCPRTDPHRASRCRTPRGWRSRPFSASRNPLSRCDDLGLQRRGLRARLDDALRLPALHVEEHAGEADACRPSWQTSPRRAAIPRGHRCPASARDSPRDAASCSGLHRAETS